DRLVKDVDDFVASAVVLYDQMNRGGSAGNAVVMH
ncbi:Rha family transcriptional regulator, partial [Escherichia coli]